jgi:hypothetical protein
MKEMTAAITDLTENLKNVDWREAKIAELRDVFSGLWTKVKQAGSAFGWIIDHYQEIVAGFLAVKIALFGLNAVMLANPIGMVVAGVGLLIVGLAYVITKFNLLTPIIDLANKAFNALWEGIKSMASGFYGIMGHIVGGIFWLIEKVLQGVDSIPKELLPDSWGKGITEAHEGVKKLRESIQNNADFHLGIDEQSKMLNEQEAIFKNATLQSKSTVDIRIQSDKPVTIEGAKTDSRTDLNVDAGMLLGSVF